MMRTIKTAASALAFAGVLALGACATTANAGAGASAAPASQAATADIPREQVLAAQKAWGDALVKIATTHDTQGAAAARRVAEEVIDTAYGYNLGPVLFKPTLTVAPRTFRTTREGALAYFVGGDPNFPEDNGFALNGWRSYEIQNAAVFIKGDVAITTGNVRLTNSAGAVTVVDKTWGFARDSEGKLRIVSHHSSLPYTGN
jgi:hypothetical protein